MTTQADVLRAKAEAERARERLLGSTHELQSRLRIGTLASNAWDGVLERSEAAAQKAANAASRRPWAAAAGLIGVTALAARKPLGRLLARFRTKTNSDDGDE